MKNIIILILVLLCIGCTDPLYKRGDKICAYNKELTILSVNTFSGTGAGLKGTNYDCRYIDKLGSIQKVNIYEKEIKPCN